MHGWMDGKMTPPSSLPDGDFSPLIHLLISFLPFRESLWPCHGYSRCVLRDGHFHSLYLPGKEKADLQISVRTQRWGVGGRGQEVALSVADTPLALPHIPLAHPTLWLILIRVVAFLLSVNTEC